MAPASPARSVALRRLRCQWLICWPIAFFALGLTAGEKLTKKASSATGPPTTEGVAEKVEAGVLRLVTALRVFAVQVLRLVGMQLKAQGPEPLNEAGAELLGLLLGVAADDHIIGVTLERTAGVFAVHPLVERIVHEEVREQRRDRRSLWGSRLSRCGGSVSHRHGGFEPPLDVEQHPTLVGVVSDRLHEQIMANAVKEGPRHRDRAPSPCSNNACEPPPTRHGHFAQAGTGSCRGTRSAQASLPPASRLRSEPPGLPHSPHPEP